MVLGCQLSLNHDTMKYKNKQIALKIVVKETQKSRTAKGEAHTNTYLACLYQIN